MDFELEEEYKKESGFDVDTLHEAGTVYHGDDYVEWLERKLKKLRLGGVGQLREQLIAFLRWEHQSSVDLSDKNFIVDEYFKAIN